MYALAVTLDSQLFSNPAPAVDFHRALAMDGTSSLTRLGAGAAAGTLAADGCAGAANSSTERNTAGAQDERKNKGKDLFVADWPELGLDDFVTDLRHFDPAFEIESTCFDDTLWSSISSSDAQLVPSSSRFDIIDLSAVGNESTADPVAQSSVSVPGQISVAQSTNTQQQPRTAERAKPLSCEAQAGPSSMEIGQFSQNPDAELFCPFDDIASVKQIGGCEGLEAVLGTNRETRAPSAPSTMCNDGTVSSSSACPGPDLAATHLPPPAKKPQAPLHGAPDMILDGIAENPLDMYFPPLATYEQPQVVTSASSSAQTHPQFPVDFAGKDTLNCAGLQFGSKGGRISEESHQQQPCSKMVLDSVPVKDLGFQKLQEGMNQMDVATKSRIRDALYRLANGVEQRHYGATGAVGSSGSKRRVDGNTDEPHGSVSSAASST
ncbi:hypothetical protein ACP4OV_000315 [Aristida adscensionis]